MKGGCGGATSVVYVWLHCWLVGDGDWETYLWCKSVAVGVEDLVVLISLNTL